MHPYAHIHTREYTVCILFHKILGDVFHKMKNIYILYIVNLFHKAQVYVIVTFCLFTIMMNAHRIYICVKFLFNPSKISY